MNTQTGQHILDKDIEIEVALNQNKSFKAKLHEIGARNERGQMPVNLKKLKAMNTFLNKKLHRKYTWQSPDGYTKCQRLHRHKI